MKILFFLFFVCQLQNIYGSDLEEVDVEMGLPGAIANNSVEVIRSLSRTGTNLSEDDSKDSEEIAKETNIRKAVVTEAHDLLSEDFKKNLKDLLWTRLLFRKVANISESFGNFLSATGVGLTTLSAATHLIKADNLSNILLFSGSACFAAHLTFIGIAKCSAREEEEREMQLKNMADEVKFNVISLIPNIQDDANAQRS